MQNKKVLGILCIPIFCILILLSFAQGPDTQLHFYREVPSKLSPERLDRMMSSVTRWPQWFYSLGKVDVLNGNGSSLVQTGSLLTLHMDPNKGERKRFTIQAKVLEYIPGRTLKIQILEDSSGRLTRLFSHLEWDLELKTNQQGSLIQGKALAQTHHWRSRVFGRLSERILMNQVFYPNLMKLSELNQPFSVDQSSDLLQPRSAM